MNLALIVPEISVVALALLILLLDLWTPVAAKVRLGYLAIGGLLLILAMTWAHDLSAAPAVGFGGMFQADGLGLFFKRFFIIAAVAAIALAMDFSARIASGISELYALMLIALSGMMFAASVNDLVLAFVALELISVTFYILVSFQRGRLLSLEAGVKYLILSALSAAFLVFGIALIFGASGVTNFTDLNHAAPTLVLNKAFWLGLLLVLIGLSFKIAAFPLQMWAPDVYQGAPTPVTAFLAIGSKAAGFALALRILFIAFPLIAARWDKLLIVTSGVTILYGNLCAIPQRSLKRLLGYSSIANAGYLLLGVSAVSASGSSAVLYYLAGYLATLVAVFAVISVVGRESDDISAFAGLHQRSPFLAAGMTLGMVSLAGIPPLAGFLGKFLLLRSVIDRGFSDPAYFWLAGVAVIGVVISLYYYFGVVRTMYWQSVPADAAPLQFSAPMKTLLALSVIGMLYLGVCPSAAFNATVEAVKSLRF
ncbi:MAG TPA: NADH-quinone oxidoreductase subunit N [Verrucomicrobiae bacterium]|jgi:NADH-quinone oxidoreductase subunit N|nr:NADH-quinone oxidoreductase subunit N [Verrucomicrobiae bacterium]